MRTTRAFCCRLGIALALAASWMIAAQGQSSLIQITSPASGTVVQQGQTVTVNYTADASVTNLALTAEFTGGFVGQPTSPGTFSLPIPATTPIDSYQVYVAGTSGCETVVSNSITLVVDTPYSIQSITTTPATIQFDKVGDIQSLTVTGTLSNASTAIVTYSPQVTYSSTNTSVATVDTRGNVTAAGQGNTYIAINYGSGSPYNVFVSVPIPPAASPTFSPAAGSFTSPQTVTIKDSASGSAIYYTADGSAPTAQSTLYSAPISVSSTQTLSAVAIVSNVPNSIVSTAKYLILTPTMLSLAASSTQVNQGNPVTLTAKLSPASSQGQSADGETVTFNNGTSALGTGTLSGGVATYQANSLAAGMYSITASYPGDSNLAPSDSLPVTVTVIAPGYALSVSPSSATVSAGESTQTTISVTPSGGFTGTVKFSCSVSNSPTGLTCLAPSANITGTSAVTSALTVNTSSSTPAGGYTATVTASDAATGKITQTATFSVTVKAVPSFTAGSGGTTSISVAPGATSGNTGKIVVVGTNGFIGTVDLSCNITTAMSGVNDMPTCSLNPASVALSGPTAQSSKFTVLTTAPSSAENEIKKFFGPIAGGTALALLAFLPVPRRRRNWLRMFGFIALLVSLGLTGCGGSSKSGGGGGNSNPGTTAGTYTITVTGTSGSTIAVVGTITLTVQ